MSPNAIADLWNELDGIDAPPAVKRQIRNRLYKWGETHGVRVLRKRARVDFAAHLLGLSVSVSTIRDRLMATYDIAESQAYRDLQEALNLRHFRPLNGTQEAENNSIELRLGGEHGSGEGGRRTGQGSDQA